MNRPASVTVFGVLNIVFGVFGVLGAAMGALALLMFRAMPQRPGMPTVIFPKIHPVADAWTMIGIPLGLVVTVILIVAGVGLLRMRPWGRKLSLAYVIYALFAAGIGLTIQVVFVIPTMHEQVRDLGTPEATGGLIGAYIGVGGVIVGLVYPGLMWYFLTRPHVIAAFGGAPIEPVAAAWPPQPTALGEVSRDQANPYLAPQTQAPLAHGAPGGHAGVVETFVPSKNGPARASYYLGLFSLFPCLGFPLGVMAVYYGLQGLKNVRENPAVRGGAHAWVGLICGGLFGLMNLALIVLGIIGAIAAATQQR